MACQSIAEPTHDFTDSTQFRDSSSNGKSFGMEDNVTQSWGKTCFRLPIEWHSYTN